MKSAMRIVTAIALTLPLMALSAAPPRIDTTPLGMPRPVGGPGTNDRGPGWSLTWHLHNHHAFDRMQFLGIDSPFETPVGIDGCEPGTWMQSYNDGELMIADGPAVNELWYTTHFAGDLSVPFVFYLQVYNGNTMLTEVTYSWDGANLTETGGSLWANVRVYDTASCTPDGELNLVADGSTYTDAACYHIGDLITVGVNLSGASDPVVGGQFFLSFDPARLRFISAEPGDHPFTEQLFESADQPGGTIDYAVAVDQLDPNAIGGTATDSTMALITFEAIGEVCLDETLVTFRPCCPPTVVSTACCGDRCPILWELDTVTIDSTPPTFDNCPDLDPSDPNDYIVIECHEVPDIPRVVARDDCSTISDPNDPNHDPDYAVVVEPNETTIPGTCPGSYTLIRTWRATDMCDNVSICKQTIRVQDTTAPCLKDCPEDITVECHQVPPMANVTATDNCDPAPAVDPNETRIDGSCDDSYTLIRTWRATDWCDNWDTCRQIITVVDTTRPHMTAPASDPNDPDNPFDPNDPNMLEHITVDCNDIPSPYPVAAGDNCDNDPNLVFTEVESDHQCPHTYTLTRTWTFRDDCGNKLRIQRLISVRDNEAPVISNCPGDILLDSGPIPDPPEVTATDNCSANVSMLYYEVPDDSGVTRNWQFSDSCGNTSVCQQVVTLTPPPSCPGDVDGDDDVDMDDLAILLANFGRNCDDDNNAKRNLTPSAP